MSMSRRKLAFAVVASFIFACAMIATVQNILPSDEINILFREEIWNAVGVEMAEMGYVGGQITVSHMVKRIKRRPLQINGNINIGMALYPNRLCGYPFLLVQNREKARRAARPSQFSIQIPAQTVHPPYATGTSSLCFPLKSNTDHPADSIQHPPRLRHLRPVSLQEFHW